ncbi:penicillin-insensitive murein endopeptidase [Methylococcus sp. EFPC2]|uniref:penicillin-insensitive murein endopeptidase n=1 Tax=Methylococcus sp. EFPC2 TaxID=2812648 RepID=UPI0019675D23|nr:penicillin-insensitive murein endopeptidase [Methylococcus sp. EFPC2]QSA97717.1 penicillin-insensitive murein endopeptidase [Methylococcus sp. EFPC2]
MLPPLAARSAGRAILLSSILSLPALALASAVTKPTTGVPRAIGQTSNGCIAGAVALPKDGTGYMVMHLERRRYFGHPDLIATLQDLGGQMQKRGIGRLQIGDLAQARGGPMPTGHRSHQTGLDVDVWFNLDPRIYSDADALRANVNAPSMLASDGKGLNRGLWSEHHVEMLELAAHQPRVDRIFVNPWIKRELCRTIHGKRDWLHKIRPWYYHDDHFHLRLACPAGDPDCDDQDPIPQGDGCDASLDWWFEPHPPAPAVPPAAKPPLPAACAAVMDQP